MEAVISQFMDYARTDSGEQPEVSDLAALLAGCAIDVNAYRVAGGSTGPIHCRGACP